MEFRVQTLADIRERIGKKRFGLPQEASFEGETEGSSGCREWTLLHPLGSCYPHYSCWKYMHLFGKCTRSGAVLVLWLFR